MISKLSAIAAGNPQQPPMGALEAVLLSCSEPEMNKLQSRKWRPEIGS